MEREREREGETEKRENGERDDTTATSFQDFILAITGSSRIISHSKRFPRNGV